MSCNCKNPKVETPVEDKKTDNKIGTYIVNFIIYLITVTIASVVVLPFLLVVLFRVIVLNNSKINVEPILAKYFKAKKVSEDDDDDDEDDDEEYSEYFQNVELLDNNVVSK